MMTNSGRGSKLRGSLALLLALILAASCLPLTFAAAAGSSAEISPSASKTYVKFPQSAAIFTSETMPQSGSTTIAAGTVLQMVSPDTYTADGNVYACVYYNSARYNVLYASISEGILSESAFAAYVATSVWASGTYTTLKNELNLVGDVRVAALQMALSNLDYYSGRIDGNYGDVTSVAVREFQRANGLSLDGDAGPITQAILYPLALAQYNAATGGTATAAPAVTATPAPGTTAAPSTSTTGTVTTTVDLKLRRYATTDSVRLATVPKGTTLAYTDTKTVGSLTWYEVTYNNLNGWLMGTYVTVGTGTSTGGGTTTGVAGALTTKSSVNLRKSASTGSVRLAIVPIGTSLNYYTSSTVNGVAWYYVTYNNLNGWLMGTYVNANGSSSGGSSSGGTTTDTQIGTVTITLSNTRVRTSPNGSKSGYVLSKGTTLPLLASPTTAGGYNWYYVKLASGYKGYVRGDCCTASINGSGGVTPSTDKTYVKLTNAVTLFTSEEQSTTGATTVAAGTVLQLVSPQTYTVNNVVYCSIYYNNTQYNCVYSDVSGSIMSAADLTTYITGTLWPSAYSVTLKQALKLVGDVRVHGLQYALSVLGFYNGALDGNFGTDTTTAVRNFQRSNKLTVDGSVGPKTYAKLYPSAISAVNGGSGGGSSGGTTVTDFGTITSIEKATWDTVDGGSVSLFKKGTYATVLDVQTQKVFRIYRWSGGSHADCVPATSADTKVMCDIVGFPYNSSAPTSAQLAKIKGDSASDNATYAWPDFKGSQTSASSIGSAWDRRPVLVNVDGRVFACSIYGWPHGFNGTDSFAKSKFPDGSLFYATNNYYGMMCVHFVGSKTHGSAIVDSGHQAAIESAYSFAKAKWPSLTK